jgi:U3 small nucleolar RNA-associated protein 13
MAPAAEKLQAKVTYKPSAKLEVFYTGGPARISKDGKFLACACHEDVKVRSVS